MERFSTAMLHQLLLNVIQFYPVKFSSISTLKMIEKSFNLKSSFDLIATEYDSLELNSASSIGDTASNKEKKSHVFIYYYYYYYYYQSFFFINKENK